MARSTLPSPLERRHLLEREISEAQAQKLADAYLAEDRAVEAVEFLAKAGDTEGLETLRAAAVEAGDAFLLRAVAALMERTLELEEWQALARAAEAAGKQSYAAEAIRQAERWED